MKGYKIHIPILISIVYFLLQSCEIYKSIDKGKYLVTQNEVFVNNALTPDEALSKYVIQNPNKRTFDLPILRRLIGFPLYLGIYNLMDKNHKQNFLNWKKNNPNFVKFLEFLFSAKGVDKIGTYYSNINEWTINSLGEPPVIYNRSATVNSAGQLKRYFKNRGYFDAEVYTEHDLKFREAKIKYYIETKEPYYIDNIYTHIKSPYLNSLYQEEYKTKSLLKKGDQVNIPLMDTESKTLTDFFRSKAIYNFQKELITFQIDSNQIEKKVNIHMTINDSYQKAGKINLEPYTFEKVYIHLNSSFESNVVLDSVKQNNYLIYDYSKEFEYDTDFLTNSLFIEPKKHYNLNLTKNTYNRLSSLENFKNINIRYENLNNNRLNTHIYLSSVKKYFIDFNLDVTLSDYLGTGISGQLSYADKNLFGSAEILELSFRLALGNTKNTTRGPYELFNASEYGGKVKLKLPYFLIPFLSPYSFAKSNQPKSIFNIEINRQYNIGLGRISFNSGFDYQWNESNEKTHSIGLFNMQYIKNLDSDDYYSKFIFQREKKDNIIKLFKKEYPHFINLSESEVLSKVVVNKAFQNKYTDDYKKYATMLKNKERITKDIFISSSKYSFNYIDKKSNEQDKFFFRFSLEFAGNTYYLLDKILKFTERKEKGNKIFNVEYAQYIKFDIEVKKYWKLWDTTLVFRTFIGTAFTYGNSDLLPFTKSYLGGGANDIRAWNAYELGPGALPSNKKTINDYQVGNVKLTSNLEYRFRLMGDFRAALFLDIGNIWAKDENNPQSNFKFSEFYKQLAIGTGLGIRYDTGFLVFRIDGGIKLYDPAYPVKTFHIKNAIFHFGIGYPF